MPKQTFLHSATTSASVNRVWDALQQPDTWATIGGVDRVTDPVIDDRGRLQGFSFHTSAGGMRFTGKATPHAYEEGRLMAWRVDNSEVRGLTTVTLSGSHGGTRIEVTIELEPVGMLASMFFPAVATAVGNGLAAAVDSFARGLGSEGSD